MLKPDSIYRRIFYSGNSTTSVKTRDDVDEKYKWNLKDVYKDENEWEKDFEAVENKLKEYDKFEGKLNQSPGVLLNLLKLDDEIGIKIERLYLYSMLAKDTDMRVTLYQGMDDRIRGLYSKVQAVSSFIRPELLSLPTEKLLQMINSSDELKVYKHRIDDLIRTKEHTLSKREEELLALASEALQTPYNTYSMFTNADMKFPAVINPDGEEVEISHARFYAAMYSKDRGFRERAFKAYLNPYSNHINTFTSLFNGNLKANIFNAKARKYNSAREAALDVNNVPVSVYDNLLDSVNSNFAPMHRWASLKKDLLQVEELHPYDVYVTLFDAESEKEYPFEQAKEIVIESLKLLGDDYLGNLKKAFENRWIDVYETPAKRSGAYSSGTTFGVHPYVLLNWTDLLTDVFTLTHEMGHNMHSYYTGITQPYPYANYSIFVAEVASTFNESLLLDYLIENSNSKNEKLFLLEKYLNNITATFYRQVMFAEFEMMVYEDSEKGKALTPDILSHMYKQTFQKYWGKEMAVGAEEQFTWARIPHFYYNFYVYQYATGLAASEVLAKKVREEKNPAVKNYLNFLKAGSSDYPINILKKAGVDMNSPEPVIAVTEKMNSLIDEMEELLKRN